MPPWGAARFFPVAAAEAAVTLTVFVTTEAAMEDIVGLARLCLRFGGREGLGVAFHRGERTVVVVVVIQ